MIKHQQEQSKITRQRIFLNTLEHYCRQLERLVHQQRNTLDFLYENSSWLQCLPADKSLDATDIAWSIRLFRHKANEVLLLQPVAYSVALKTLLNIFTDHFGDEFIGENASVSLLSALYQLLQDEYYLNQKAGIISRSVFFLPNVIGSVFVATKNMLVRSATGVTLNNSPFTEGFLLRLCVYLQDDLQSLLALSHVCYQWHAAVNQHAKQVVSLGEQPLSFLAKPKIPLELLRRQTILTTISSILQPYLSTAIISMVDATVKKPVKNSLTMFEEVNGEREVQIQFQHYISFVPEKLANLEVSYFTSLRSMLEIFQEIQRLLVDGDINAGVVNKGLIADINNVTLLILKEMTMLDDIASNKLSQ